VAKKKKRSNKKGSNKTFASRRTLNPPQGGGAQRADAGTGHPFQDQDPARRLGGFETAGEHARTGSRGR
jgi:hypothetical protein